MFSERDYEDDDAPFPIGGEALWQEIQQLDGGRWLERLSPRRLRRMLGVLLYRLPSVTLVMENIADSHNASAMVRTAEGFGLDEIHVIERPNKFEPNRLIVRGADRWLDVHKHDRLSTCLGDLSARGFVLCAADVGPHCVPLHEVPVDKPVAVVFGTEHDGLSQKARSLTDVIFTIPMLGFTRSFNVSASASVAVYDIAHRRRLYLQEQWRRQTQHEHAESSAASTPETKLPTLHAELPREEIVRRLRAWLSLRQLSSKK